MITDPIAMAYIAVSGLAFGLTVWAILSLPATF